MLIRNADVWGHGLADVRIESGRIAAIAPLPFRGGAGGGGAPESAASTDSPHPNPSPEGEGLVDARGGALLPGLHDHHIHLAGLAVQRQSILCGPLEVETATQLAAALNRPGSGWLRGIGYHESVMGLPDARALDRLLAHRPLRIQHRSGRMWLFNSAGLQVLLASTKPPAGLESESGRFTGRLFDEDQWLQKALASAPPDYADISADLAAMGVTGITDMSPRNDAVMAAHFADQRSTGALQQSVWIAGTLGLADASQNGWRLGPAKLHLHEAALPDFDQTTAFIAAAHAQARGVAVHCVTEVELVFALAALECAGVLPGDRIEHAAVADPALVARIAAMGLHVCVQPQFVAERGDAYLRDVEPRHHGDLYRLASLAGAGISLSGGSDAPFISHDPWAGMRAAALRQTGSGVPFGPEEALSPEAALALWLVDPADLSRQRSIVAGASADLVLLDRPWAEARARLLSGDVRATFASGKIIHQHIDEAPFESGAGSNPAA